LSTAPGPRKAELIPVPGQFTTSPWQI
jgi:hypothetical protein